MIIKTSSTKLQHLLSGALMRQPNDETAFDTAAASVTMLSNLVTVLFRDYPGEWSVKFDLVTDLTSYKQLMQVDDKAEQALLLAPGYIGADSEDFIFWLEHIYGQPVTRENHKRVMQLFRVWYAATHPDEYHEPTKASPTLAALVSDGDAKRRSAANKRNQRNRRGETFKGKGWASEEALLNHLAAHPDLIPAPEEKPAGKKRCPMCETWKDYAEFHKDKNRADGLTGRCKACHHKRRAAK